MVEAVPYYGKDAAGNVVSTIYVGGLPKDLTGTLRLKTQSPTLERIRQIYLRARQGEIVSAKDIGVTVPIKEAYPKPVIGSVPVVTAPTARRTSIILEFMRKTPEEKLAYFKARHFLTRIRKAPEQITAGHFQYLYPDVQIPGTKYGKYDVVTVRNVFAPGYPGNIKKVYTFTYSPMAKHKIEVAGSIQNYNKYLNIVRTNPDALILSHMFAGPLNIDLALASTTPGITGASEREEILIKQLHRWKGSPEAGPSLERGFWAVLENPFVQIALAEATATGIGRYIAGPLEGYVAAKYGPRALQMLYLAEAGVGLGIIAPSAVSTGIKYWEGKYKEAIPETVMLSLLIGAGIEGYRIGKGTPKLWGKYKGLTPVEAGFKKGLVKSKRFDPLQKEYFNLLSDIKQDLRIRHIKPVQEEPTYMNVEALKQYNQQRANVLRTVIKNQLIALKNRAQISGGAATEKVSTHDIDMLFRSAKDPVVLEYIARKLGIDPDLVFDPHQLPGTYRPVTRSGAYKEPGYIYPSGQRGIRLTEQFYRLGESSMELAHPGRIKDISEAIRVLDLIYGKTGGIPPEMQPKVTRFLELSAILEQDPRIMDPAMSKLLYESGIGKKLWDIRIKFYRKVLPETYLEKQFNVLSNKDLNVLQNFLQARTIGGLPPSMSIPFSAASYGMALWSAYYGDVIKQFESKPSYPVDKSRYLVVKSKSRKPSEYPEYPSRPYGLTSISTTPPPGYPSSYIPPPPSSPYYSPPPGYPSAYYSPPYYPYSPSPPPPPPPLGALWFPRGGRVAARSGKLPHGVQYYDEYEMLQRLLREVIF